jgi:hypothetical protein
LLRLSCHRKRAQQKSNQTSENIDGATHCSLR